MINEIREKKKPRIVHSTTLRPFAAATLLQIIAKMMPPITPPSAVPLLPTPTASSSTAATEMLMRTMCPIGVHIYRRADHSQRPSLRGVSGWPIRWVCARARSGLPRHEEL
jgi:hypothetical protein